MKNLLLIVSLALLPLLGGHAQAVSCGDVVRGTVTLTHDLHCTSGWAALQVYDDGVTIRLNGKTLSGSGALQGIHVADAGYVRIVGPGRISGFWTGINAFRSPKVQVEGVDLTDMDSGVLLTRSPDSVVRHNGFYRIAGQSVRINDPVAGVSMYSGGVTVADNDFGKVDTGISLCGAAAGHNHIANNAFRAVYSFGIHITDHSSRNQVSGNYFHNVWGSGIQVDSSADNAIDDNRLESTSFPIVFMATHSGACTARPGLGEDNIGHKANRNYIIKPDGPAVILGDGLGRGKVAQVWLQDTVIESAVVGIEFDVNSFGNTAWRTRFLGVATPVIDRGVDNRW